jgi:hypothetical protein
LPFNDPGWRLPFTSPIGTIRATGFDPRAMITSSPSEAFAISRERFVLAWWMADPVPAHGEQVFAFVSLRDGVTANVREKPAERHHRENSASGTHLQPRIARLHLGSAVLLSSLSDRASGDTSFCNQSDPSVRSQMFCRK